MINRRTVIVSLVAISGINGVIRRKIRIKRQQKIVDSLIVLTILGLLPQMQLSTDTTRSVWLIKHIPYVCVQPGIKR